MEVLAIGIASIGERFISHSSNLVSLSSSSSQQLTRFSSIQFKFRNSRVRNRSSIGLQEKLPLVEDETERDVEEGEFEEDLFSSSSSSSFLSLTEKPDRNLVLLDEYEMEENDFDSNHRSG